MPLEDERRGLGFKTLVSSPFRRKSKSTLSKVFGQPLEELALHPGTLIPEALHCMVEFLRHNGMDAQGIFRVNGGVRTVEALKQKLDREGTLELEGIESNVYAVAGLVKAFFRELPGALVSASILLRFVAAQDEWTESEDKTASFASFRKALQLLTPRRLEVLSYLCEFLSRIASHPETKMTTSNLAIVLAPNLFAQGSPTDDAMAIMNAQTRATPIVNTLITHHRTLFKPAIKLPSTAGRVAQSTDFAAGAWELGSDSSDFGTDDDFLSDDGSTPGSLSIVAGKTTTVPLAADGEQRTPGPPPPPPAKPKDLFVMTQDDIRDRHIKASSCASSQFSSTELLDLPSNVGTPTSHSAPPSPHTSRTLRACVHKTVGDILFSEQPIFKTPPPVVQKRTGELGKQTPEAPKPPPASTKPSFSTAASSPALDVRHIPIYDSVLHDMEADERASDNGSHVPDYESIEDAPQSTGLLPNDAGDFDDFGSHAPRYESMLQPSYAIADRDPDDEDGDGDGDDEDAASDASSGRVYEIPVPLGEGEQAASDAGQSAAEASDADNEEEDAAPANVYHTVFHEVAPDADGPFPSPGSASPIKPPTALPNLRALASRPRMPDRKKPSRKHMDIGGVVGESETDPTVEPVPPPPQQPESFSAGIGSFLTDVLNAGEEAQRSPPPLPTELPKHKLEQQPSAHEPAPEPKPMEYSLATIGTRIQLHPAVEEEAAGQEAPDDLLAGGANALTAEAGRKAQIDMKVLGRRIRHFEQTFEQTHGRKPTREDKRAMYDEYKAYKRLKAIREQSKLGPGAAASQPVLTVDLETALARLSSMRQASQRTSNLQNMTAAELREEKSAIKRVVNDFENNFKEREGRALSRGEKVTIMPLYQRYKEVKGLLATLAHHAAAPPEPSELEQGHHQAAIPVVAGMVATQSPVPARRRPTDDLPARPQPPEPAPLAQTMPSPSQSQGRFEVATKYARLKAEKKDLQRVLHKYEKDFEREHQRPVSSKADREPLLEKYTRYKELKKKLSALEAEGPVDVPLGKTM